MAVNGSSRPVTRAYGIVHNEADYHASDRHTVHTTAMMANDMKQLAHGRQVSTVHSAIS